ncbi:MAG: ApbE-like protein thiamine biosynthesis lipoprotein [Candidatus Taylorbacteria bacterium]|nr:ApbE-like protein thiamine biosynthesis lipoprotein [Candidatus Taylorbacteria bacterium]
MPQFNFDAIGTKWQIDIFEYLDRETEANILIKINSRIEEFDKAYSRFLPSSLITAMSKKAGVYVVPEDAQELLKIYFDLYQKTNGLFTPLVGNLLSDAGYDAEYSLKQKNELKAPLKWEEVMEYDHPNLTIKIPSILDFGAGGKGYLIDIIGKLLEENNITKYCIDGSGDMLCKNSEAIRVGLENPFDLDQVIGTLDLQNKSICGSAGTRRKWGEFTHIIDPMTLKSPTDVVAVWVVADTALIADCIATCLFFVHPESLLNSYQFEYVIIKNDKSILRSVNFAGQIFA